MNLTTKLYCSVYCPACHSVMLNLSSNVSMEHTASCLMEGCLLYGKRYKVMAPEVSLIELPSNEPSE